MENIYISIVGIVYLFMLFIPNMIWVKNTPENYDSSHENKILLMFERFGEVLVCCFGVIMFRTMDWNIFVLVSFVFMLMYEGYWIQYFKSEKKLSDFYCSYLKIPLAGATLPVIAFLILGLSQGHWLLVFSTIILGIGHIGIHREHFLVIKKRNVLLLK